MALRMSQSISQIKCIVRLGVSVWMTMKCQEKTSLIWVRWWCDWFTKWMWAGRNSLASTLVSTKRGSSMMRNSKNKEVSERRLMIHLTQTRKKRNEWSQPNIQDSQLLTEQWHSLVGLMIRMVQLPKPWKLLFCKVSRGVAVVLQWEASMRTMAEIHSICLRKTNDYRSH
jgi:hypothetical protein